MGEGVSSAMVMALVLPLGLGGAWGAGVLAEVRPWGDVAAGFSGAGFAKGAFGKGEGVDFAAGLVATCSRRGLALAVDFFSFCFDIRGGSGEGQPAIKRATIPRSLPSVKDGDAPAEALFPASTRGDGIGNEGA